MEFKSCYVIVETKELKTTIKGVYLFKADAVKYLTNKYEALKELMSEGYGKEQHVELLLEGTRLETPGSTYTIVSTPLHL